MCNRDLQAIFSACTPEVVYLHISPTNMTRNSGRAALPRSIARHAGRETSRAGVLGCEVWRDLDWMSDDDKNRPRRGAAAGARGGPASKAFDSRLTAASVMISRRWAVGWRNATFHTSHATDQLAGHHVGDGPHAVAAGAGLP